MRQLIVSTMLIAFLANFAQGGSLIQNLPKDDGWISFRWTETWEDGEKRASQVVVKSVGKEMRDDVPCRWIELEFQPEADAEKKAGAWKFLIPEKQLTADGDPLSHVKECWKSVAGDQAVQVAMADVQSARPRLDLLLSPPIPTMKKTSQRETIDWQQGKLECSVTEVKEERKYSADHVEVNYRLLLSEKAPFGVAACRLKLRALNDGDSNGTVEFIMTDMGANAMSIVKQP
jgi:hypothetical protein